VQVADVVHGQRERDAHQHRHHQLLDHLRARGRSSPPARMQAAALAAPSDQAGPEPRGQTLLAPGAEQPRKRLPWPGSALLAGALHADAHTCAPASFRRTVLNLNSAHRRLLPEQQSQHTRVCTCASSVRACLRGSCYSIPDVTPLRIRSSSGSWHSRRLAAGRRAVQRAARLVQEVGEGGVQAIADLAHVHRPLQHDGRQVRARAVRRQDGPARPRSPSPPSAGQHAGGGRVGRRPAPPSSTALSWTSQPTS